MKNKILLLSVLCLILIIFTSGNFNNLSMQDRIKLAVAYYKVAQYYYDHGDSEKGDQFAHVAKYLDPVNYNKPLPDKKAQKNYTKQDYISSLLQIKQAIDNLKYDNIENFISFPCYMVSSEFAIQEKDDFLKTLEFIFNKYSQYFTDKDDSYTMQNYQELNEKINFIPMIYQEDDIFITITGEKNKITFIFRLFGNYYKLVGVNY